MKQKITNYKKTAFFLIFFLVLIVLICLIWIIAGAFGYSHFAASPTSQNSKIAELYQNGDLIQSISLDTVTEPYTFVVTGENGCQNEVEIRPGSIGILSASCPDKICVHQGFISTSLLPITCLPNHLVIQIRMEDTAAENDMPDIIAY